MNPKHVVVHDHNLYHLESISVREKAIAIPLIINTLRRYDWNESMKWTIGITQAKTTSVFTWDYPKLIVSYALNELFEWPIKKLALPNCYIEIIASFFNDQWSGLTERRK